MSMYTDTNRILKMRGTGCRVPSMDNPYVNGFSRPLPFYSDTHLVVHQRCFLYSPLLTWFFVVSPLCLTFFFASRNVSESKIHILILQRHKREIFMRMDTFTVYSTFDWDQLVKNSRPHTRTAGENALKLVKKISLNVIC